MNLPKIVSADDNELIGSAHQLLREARPDCLFIRRATRITLQRCSAITAIFSDLDGTLLNEGSTQLSKDVADTLIDLASLGISITFVTGKPYAEVMPLVQSLPPNLSVKIMYEKGAYELVHSNTEGWGKQYLLTSPANEAAMARLREIFLAEKRLIEQKYLDARAQPKVLLGWAGTGTHESVLSIDVLRGNIPANYLDVTGKERDALKVTRPDLLAAVEADLEVFTRTHQPAWKVIHLGNGNSEITPTSIEKDQAIIKTTEFQNAQQVLILGDSNNDRTMFALRDGIHVMAGLVLYRESTLQLVREVDLIIIGEAQAGPMLRVIAAAKRGEALAWS